MDDPDTVGAFLNVLIYVFGGALILVLALLVVEMAGLWPRRRASTATGPASPTVANGIPGQTPAIWRSLPFWVMPRWAQVVLVVGALVFGWHLMMVAYINQRARTAYRESEVAGAIESISINPIINLVTVKMRSAQKSAGVNPAEDVGTAIGEALVQMVGPGFIERGLRTAARSHYDLYAILIPYRVQIIMVASDQR